MTFERIMSLVGLLVFIGLAYAMSNNRKAIKWKPVIGGCALQLVFALFILKTPIGHKIFDAAKAAFNQILSYSADGAKFVWGPLADMGITGNIFGGPNAFIFAIQISATIIFISALFAMLYHIGVMQWIVRGFAIVMQKVMGTTGSESLASAANVFMGQTEAPLAVRPYLDRMTNSEIMAMMTGGMATVAGGVLAAYVGMGIDAGHLLAASVMSAPATLAIAKLMIPETEKSETEGTIPNNKEKTDSNVLDAACRGAGEGLTLSLNVMAMLVAFIALIAMLNHGIAGIASFFTETPVTLETILGYLFAPFAFLMGVPKEDILQVGSLLGVKTTVNEFVAYINLSGMKETLSPRSVTIATYALCGFANFASIAIQIGGIGSLVPKRRKDYAAIGFKAMIGGTLAAFMTACFAGLLI